MFDDRYNPSIKDLFFPLTTKKAIIWIVVVGLIVYANMLFNGFVWDDKIYITLNPGVHSIDFIKLIGVNSFNNIGQYRPIPAIYFATLYNFFGELSFFYHLPQLTLHIINAILVFYLLRKFFARHISLLLSLIFLIHPIQVESVSFIAATISPLFFIFGISALLISTNNKLNTQRIILISFLILASLLTKETGILFVFMLVIYRIIFNKTGKFLLISSMICTLLVYIAIRFGVGGTYFTHLQNIPLNELTLRGRLLNIPEIIFYYFKTVAYPVYLAHNQLWVITQSTFQNFYFPVLVVSSVFVFIFLFGLYTYKVTNKLFRVYLFFLFWFLLGLIMHLNIFPLDQTVADRWFYFPFVGLLGMVGVGLELIVHNRKKLERVTYISLAIVIILFSVRTIIRNTNWVDAITLYTHDMKIHNNFDIETNLATEYLLAHRYNEAVLHFNNSIKMFPYESNLYNLAYTYEQMGNTEMALRYYHKALNAANLEKNNTPELSTYEGLSRLLLITGSYPEADKIINQGLVHYPNSANLWKYSAIALYQLHKQSQALEAARHASLISPSEDISALILQIQNNIPISFIR